MSLRRFNRRTIINILLLPVIVGFFIAAAPAISKSLPAAKTAAAVTCPDGSTVDDPTQCPKTCERNGFFGLKPWYAYIPLKPYPDCSATIDFVGSQPNPDARRFDVIWLIGLVVFEDLLRIAGMVA